jgi:hypothetical protein
VLGLIHVEYRSVLMFALTLVDGLCCAWLLYTIWCWCRRPETGISSIQSLKRCVLNKNRAMNNGQRHNICGKYGHVSCAIPRYFHYRNYITSVDNYPSQRRLSFSIRSKQANASCWDERTTVKARCRGSTYPL